MADSLYASCAEVLSLAQSQSDDLAALLDPESGFAPRLRQLCHDQLKEYQESTDGLVTQEEMDVLRMEENTWALLQALMPARKTEPSPLPHARTLLALNPYTPTATLAQAILNASPLLTELLVVREWLHDTAPKRAHPEATNGYWRFTKHGILQARRMGGSGRGGLVKEMDPDAPNRAGGLSLAADDTSYEKSLAQALYAFIRAGRLDDAVDLCRNAHQPWRAASIRGSLLFTWRALDDEPREDDAMDTTGADDNWEGNRRRKLWKSTCTRAALNPSLSDAERVLYAALAPSPQTSAVLKGACRTWEDHTWAQVSVLCEEKQSAEMLRLGGSFWEDGVGALEQGGRAEPADEEEEAREEEEWAQEALKALGALGSVRVEEGPSADHAFHVSQLNIILNQMDALLEAFAAGLRDGLHQVSPEYPILARFFAHLCLYLRLIDTPMPPLATQVILEAYLQVLEAAGQRELIALYAGALGDNAVERYAMFLTSLELSADAPERRRALTRAKEHGLDVDRVAIATAERTIEKAFEMLPQPKGELPSLLSFPPPPSDAEMLLIRSTEWTTFMESTYDTTLEQANVILRYFLAAGRVQLARDVLATLPPEIASITAPEERATEYLEYRRFFTLWDTLARIVECHALDAPGMSRDTRAAWVEDYTGLIEQAYEQGVKLLTGDWLLIDPDVAKPDRRSRELVRIRQIYIPELIIRLHVHLVNSRIYAPLNLKRALELVNVVADSRYRLYEDFADQEGRTLGDYLGAVRDAVVKGLEGGGSDPFKPLAM